MPGTRSTSLLAASLCLVTTLAHADDPYAAYRIPAHHWLSWTASAGGAGDHRRDQSTFGGLENEGSFNGFARTSLAAGLDSDRLLWSWTIVPLLSGSRSYGSQDQASPLGRNQLLRRDRRSREDISSGFTTRVYPWTLPVGVELGSSQRLDLQQSWTSNDRTSTSPTARRLDSSNSTLGGYSVGVDATASVGVGRVRDATPVYQAQVLETRLRSLGTLQRELSAHARDQLVALYTVEPQLAFAHDRPTKYFWRELERVLREDGALAPDGLDAFAVQRLLEPLTIRNPYARPRGWFVGPQVAVTTLRVHTSTAFVTSSALYQSDTLTSATETRNPRRRTNRRSDLIASGFGAEYHRPLGMRWQADGATRLFLTERGETASLRTSLALAWLVADRWLATTGFSQALEAPGHGLERKPQQWSTLYKTQVSYFLEDDWSLDLTWTMDQDHERSFYVRHEGFTIVVNRRLAGRFAAPGVVEPMRLSPPTE